MRHGAKVTFKLCNQKGCTKYAKKGGVYIKHGVKVNALQS